MTKSPSAVSLSTANATAADSTLAQVPEGSVLGNCSADSDDGRGWYITQDDLGFFKYTAEQDGEVPGAGAWEQMMDKDIPNQIKYTSFRRTLPVSASDGGCGATVVLYVLHAS